MQQSDSIGSRACENRKHPTRAVGVGRHTPTSHPVRSPTRVPGPLGFCVVQAETLLIALDGREIANTRRPVSQATRSLRVSVPSDLFQRFRHK